MGNIIEKSDCNFVDFAMYTLWGITSPHLERSLFISENALRGFYLRQAKNIIPLLEDSFIKRELEREVEHYSKE